MVPRQFPLTCVRSSPVRCVGLSWSCVWHRCRDVLLTYLCGVKIISLTGPESTGKTYLASSLATAFGARWVPEYARDFLITLGRPYTERDLIAIMYGQQSSIEAAKAQGGELLFLDTDMLVLKVWSLYKYGHCAPEIEAAWQSEKSDLYLLCGTDVPWEEDPLREHPEERDRLYAVYERELLESGRKFVPLWGDWQSRTDKALKAIAELKWML